MTDEKKIIQDVYLLLGYFGADTKASHADIVKRVKDLDTYWPQGGAHFSEVIDAVLSVFLNKEITDVECHADYLQKYFCDQAPNDGTWESKLRELVATGPEVAAAINVLTDAIVEVWEKEPD